MKGRYDNVPIVTIRNRNAITSVDAHANRPLPSNIKTRIIKYNGIERLDQLADRYLGSPKYWWVIAKMNGLYANVWRIQTGVNLVIPENVNDVLDYF
jgi:hypothetical protein